MEDQQSSQVIEAPAQSSVEIKEDAKGVARLTVKAYGTDVQNAAIEAIQAYYRTKRVLTSVDAVMLEDPTESICEAFEIESEEEE